MVEESVLLVDEKEFLVNSIIQQKEILLDILNEHHVDEVDMLTQQVKKDALKTF